MCGGSITSIPRATTTAAAGESLVKRTMTRAEVREESHPDKNCLIIINDCVYNMTKWMDYHPGGRLTIRALSGRDATDAFYVNHPKSVHNDLKVLYKGFFYAQLQDAHDIDNVTKDYRELTLKMEEAGLFETEYTFYCFLIVRIFLIFALVLAGCFLSDSPYVHAVSGMLLGVFWQQLAFVGHDIGHNGVTHDRIKDSAMGFLLGNFFTGISVAWWKRSHNVHHVITNSIEHDPDIQHMPFFAVNSRFLKKPVFSTFYNDYQPLNALSHAMISVQHYLYFPVMAFARFFLYLQSFMHAFGVGPYDWKERVYKREWQILSMLGFWTWLIALTMSLPTWTSRILFFVLAHNVAGILHIQITLSHFGMPAFEGDFPAEEVQKDGTVTGGFIRTQLDGTLDIQCNPKVDWFHGGLQFQTVHHLWPRLPRRNLRKAQAILISFCDKHNLKYVRADFTTALQMTIDKLKETAKTAKSFHDIFYDGINLQG